jgi:hypothetical protein
MLKLLRFHSISSGTRKKSTKMKKILRSKAALLAFWGKYGLLKPRTRLLKALLEMETNKNNVLDLKNTRWQK